MIYHLIQYEVLREKMQSKYYLIAIQYFDLMMCVRVSLQFIYYKLCMNRQQRLINSATMMVVQLQSRKPAQRIPKIKITCVVMKMAQNIYIPYPLSSLYRLSELAQRRISRYSKSRIILFRQNPLQKYVMSNIVSIAS